MVFPIHRILISIILIQFIVQINGGYWICDWVSGRGWLYCSHGYCNAFAGKRSINIDDEQTVPIQNDDGVYCIDNKFCYTCQPITNNLCHLTELKYYSPSLSITKRTDEDACA
jgi:hypothetical protein